MPSKARKRDLKDRLVEVLEELADKETDRVARFRLRAEAEDLGDGHWDGMRMDFPPESWQD